MAAHNYALSSAQYAPETAPILLKGTICENLKKAAALGYQAIEIHLRENDPIDFKAVKHMMKATDVGISMIVTGRLNTEGGCSLIDDRPYAMKAAVEGVKQYIYIASEFGAGIILGWAIGNIPKGALCRTHYMDRLAANLREICAYAAEKNVTVNVEIINHYEVNVFTSAAKFAEFQETYHIPNLYAHLDVYHMNLEELDFKAAVERVKGQIGYVHLADSTRLYPGSARIDFKEVLDLMDAAGYQGYFSVECFPVPTGEEAAKRAISHMRSLE